MADRVFLHIGAPKTGTTYVQDRLSRNAKSLAKHGVHFPSRSPLVSPALFHFRAALDVLDQDWGGPSGHAKGSWDALAKRVRRLSGTVVISHEILAPAAPEVIDRIIDDLGDAEVHVVYTARDLARALPAGWQESVKQGRKWRFSVFLKRAKRGEKLWFAKAVDIPKVLSAWSARVPAERIHLITIPSGQASPLWTRFCQVVGIEESWAPLESDRTNASLGSVETAVIRKLNDRLPREVRRRAEYDVLVRELLAQKELAGRRSKPIRIPPTAYDWVEERTERWSEWVEQSGVDVVGSVDELRVPRPDPEEKWHDPDRVKPRRQLVAALDALAAMTHEAAGRPDPHHGPLSKLRKRGLSQD
jgi:hypothetical protein